MKMEELLEKVARELCDRGESVHKRKESCWKCELLQKKLKRRLLPLLEAGQAMYDATDFEYCGMVPSVLQWKAALKSATGAGGGDES